MNFNNNTFKDPPFRKIVVAGVARNCGKFIVKDIQRLQKAVEDFDQVQFLVIESDSDDNTLVKLDYLQNTLNNFHYISLGELKTQIPKRTERIAFCRNRYLEELEKNDLFRDAEYVMITDLDGTNELLTRESIESCWKIYDWDVCTANQQGNYYDIWALRHPLLSPNDCWKVFWFLTAEMGEKTKAARKKAFNSRMLFLRKSLKPFEVDSAFGGLAIYKRKILNNIRYSGIDEHGAEVCEHVALNRQIKERGGKIYINPELINCYPPTQYVKSGIKKMILTLTRKFHS